MKATRSRFQTQSSDRNTFLTIFLNGLQATAWKNSLVGPTDGCEEDCIVADKYFEIPSANMFLKCTTEATAELIPENYEIHLSFLKNWLLVQTIRQGVCCSKSTCSHAFPLVPFQHSEGEMLPYQSMRKDKAHRMW